MQRPREFLGACRRSKTCRGERCRFVYKESARRGQGDPPRHSCTTEQGWDCVIERLRWEVEEQRRADADNLPATFVPEYIDRVGT